MTQLSMEFVVVMEPKGVPVGQPTTWTVITDQRDLAKWEVQPGGRVIRGGDDVTMTAMRYLAWSASTRQQLTTLTLAQWADLCIECMPPDEDEAAVPADAEDPGTPTP